jgi:hypothetical protein
VTTKRLADKQFNTRSVGHLLRASDYFKDFEPLDDARLLAVIFKQTRQRMDALAHFPQPPVEPFTFRLPSKGTDPHFGMTRGFYYKMEAEGQIALIRLRSKDKSRGVTLVPYGAVKALIVKSTSQHEPFTAN